MSNSYTDQQVKFVEFYLEESKTNDNYNDVARKAREAAGYPEHTSITGIMKAVKDLILEGLNLQLAQMSPRLIRSLEGVLNEPSLPGAKNIIAVAATLLDRAGIIKKEESTVNIKTPDGVLILPAKVKEEEN